MGTYRIARRSFLGHLAMGLAICLGLEPESLLGWRPSIAPDGTPEGAIPNAVLYGEGAYDPIHYARQALDQLHHVLVNRPDLRTRVILLTDKGGPVG